LQPVVAVFEAGVGERERPLSYSVWVSVSPVCQCSDLPTNVLVPLVPGA